MSPVLLQVGSAVAAVSQYVNDLMTTDKLYPSFVTAKTVPLAVLQFCLLVTLRVETLTNVSHASVTIVCIFVVCVPALQLYYILPYKTYELPTYHDGCMSNGNFAEICAWPDAATDATKSQNAVQSSSVFHLATGPHLYRLILLNVHRPFRLQLKR